MRLSVTETATVLGKSPRQVRYMIQLGQLKAERQGKAWRIDGESLPLEDPTDFVDAKRGFIATDNPLLIPDPLRGGELNVTG